MTDPIRDGFDGAFIHILRYYKPQKAYLFLTKEIAEYDDQDDRYKIAANKISALLGFTCEIVKLYHREIDNPQEFEIFYEPFEIAINNMHKENPTSKILVNVSSGTPQMKNACNMICALSYLSLLPIQVFSPNEKGNANVAVYDLEKEWSNLIDNDCSLEPKNRNKEIKTENFRAMLSREIIIKHINAFDYNAAKVVAEGIEYFISKGAIDLINVGRLRLSLSFSKLDSYMAGQKITGILPVKTSGIREIFECILSLKIKIEKNELTDFVRGITPVIDDLFEEYLNGKCKINVKRDFCEERGYYNDKVYKITKEKLERKGIAGNFEEYYGGEYRESALSASNLFPLLRIYSKDNGITEIAGILREFASKIRNRAAHEIVGISDEQLKKDGIPSCKEILRLIQKLFSATYNQYSDKMLWNSYEDLNKRIIEKIK